MEEEHTCSYCDAEFKITHDDTNDVQFCPFCAVPLESNDEEDSETEY